MTRHYATETRSPHAIRSAPFDPPERGRIAVEIVTATPMEMTATHDVRTSLS